MTYQTHLFSHIFLVLRVSISGLFKRVNSDTSLPLRYGNFTLNKIVKTFPCGIGIYHGDKGQQVLIKVWRGSLRNYAYYQLLKEVNLYELIHKALNRLGNDINPKYKNVYIPRLLEKDVSPTKILAVFEYIDNCTHLRDIPSFSEKSKAHDLAVDFWTYIGNQLTDEEKLQIPRRTLTDTFIIYGVVLVYAIIRYPKQISSLIKTVPIAIGAVPSLVKNWQETLIHRDFHFENILVNDKNITIIDFGDNAITHPLQVFTNSLHWEWDNHESRNIILNCIASSYGRSPETDRMFRALFAMSAVQLLHDTGSKKRLELNFRCFNSVVSDWKGISAVLSGNVLNNESIKTI